jgi:enoyl-CoA hydratase/carnithine racemase
VPAFVHHTQQDAVRTLEIRREPTLSWDLPTLDQLADALVDADADPDTRVVVLRARGSAFCTGGAIGGPEEGRSVDAHRRRYVDAFVRLDSVLRETGTPTVVRAHGPVLAGGLAVVAACDVVVAGPAAVAATPEVTGGLFPLLAMGLLHEHLPPKTAMRLFLGGEPLSAAEAVGAGLFTEATGSEEELDARVDWWTTRLAEANPRAVAIGRRAFWRMASLPSAMRVEIGGQALLELIGISREAPNQDYMQRKP